MRLPISSSIHACFGALCLLAATCFSASARAAVTTFDVNSFVVEGNTVISPAQADALLRRHTGRERSLDDIEAAAETLRAAYEAAGYPVVKVFVPEQTAEDGRIVLRVIEAAIDRVHVRDNLYLDRDNILTALPSVRAGKKPDIPRILREIAVANENPARYTTVNLQASEQAQTVDAVIRVRDETPLRASLTLDNTGSSLTGKNRIELGLRHANLFNRDHVLSLTAATTDQPERGYVASATWRMPVYAAGLWIEARALHADSNASFSTGVGDSRFNGQGDLYGVRLSHTLQPVGSLRHSLSAGIDDKQFRQRCDGVLRDACGDIGSRPVQIGYSAQWAEGLTTIAASATHARNLPGNSDANRNNYARLNAEPDWSVWRAAGTMLSTFPGDVQLRLGFNGQYTRDRLIPGEQAPVGGASSVRGYGERSLNNARALTLNAELLSPRRGRELHQDLEYRWLAFADWGQTGGVSRNGSLERSQILVSSGMGVRGQWGEDIRFRLDIGVALRDLPDVMPLDLRRRRGDTLGHAGMTILF